MHSGAKLTKHKQIMTGSEVPRIAKWPFIAGDLLLVGVAVWIVNHYAPPLEMWALFCLTACVAIGAWLAVTPFLVQYQATLKFAEADALTTAVEQINSVRTLANQISFATAQWQVVQEHAGRTVEEARSIGEKMTEEARAFGEFMAKANDREKGHLRLEVDKLRRGQEEWLQVLVGLLDHVFALYRAGLGSGQENLVNQLTNYQMACRDMVRRLGLIPFEAQTQEPFNRESHQLTDPQASPPDGSHVTETLATGYTFQGQLLRRAVVKTEASPLPAPEEEATVPLGNS